MTEFDDMLYLGETWLVKTEHVSDVVLDIARLADFPASAVHYQLCGPSMMWYIDAPLDDDTRIAIAGLLRGLDLGLQLSQS